MPPTCYRLQRLYGLTRRVWRRSFATTVHDETKSMIAKSAGTFREKLKQGKYDEFDYDLIKRHYDETFFRRYEPFFLKYLGKIESRLIKESAKEENKIEDRKILNDFITPRESSAPYLIDYVARHKSEDDVLRKLPCLIPSNVPKEEVPQKIVDGIMERLVYNSMKPHNLQFVYNDASNNQNFNNNLTFNIMDIDNPYEWFPEARKLKRKFIMHVGPTNSGKTYHALKRLENCSKGYFAGPLRLLAREVYDKFQTKGIRCNLVTGEEVIVDVDENGNKAGVTSGTIEMLSLTENYDVIVVDEIQMIGDQFRGSAWTNAILGARAKEIHICGEVSAVPLIKRLVAMTGDELEINEYKRLGKLVVDDQTIGMNDLKKGDCIVCFSKTAILDMKLQIEQQTNLRSAVIYGALPPETRAQEAQRFNEGYYDIVVASDAIGMGLNLKINRVVFTTTQKFNGRQNVSLTASNVKQIGGRAGRYGIGDSVGHITAISEDELENVRKGIESPVEFIDRAILWPPEDLWVRYYSMFTKDTDTITMYRKFETDLSKLYRSTRKMKRDFQVESLDEKKTISQFFNQEKLMKNFNIADQLRCISAPTTLTTNPNQPLKLVLNYILKEFVENIINRTKKSLFDFDAIPFYLLSTENLANTGTMRNKVLSKRDSSLLEAEPVPAGIKPEILKRLEKQEIEEFRSKKSFVKRLNPIEDRLMKLEQFHKMLSSYMWLSYRFPQNFIDIESAMKLKELAEFKISEMLGSLRSTSTVNSRRFKTFKKH
ncbi:DEKNAAC104991 [Brettanomyces naardenensis]|uniref:ATP-dependent RNA helicase SUV3, mitochondrial n=1 Tax=Brettanomyces naardenensis TaxID=13370 RepID=A0A448YS65_BRENA|nr:DEKNAAC104991 [Brettanomyces naardenensis]